jgi:hypothetical protein
VIIRSTEEMFMANKGENIRQWCTCQRYEIRKIRCIRALARIRPGLKLKASQKEKKTRSCSY